MSQLMFIWKDSIYYDIINGQLRKQTTCSDKWGTIEMCFRNVTFDKKNIRIEMDTLISILT